MVIRISMASVTPGHSLIGFRTFAFGVCGATFDSPAPAGSPIVEVDWLLPVDGSRGFDMQLLTLRARGLFLIFRFGFYAMRSSSVEGLLKLARHLSVNEGARCPTCSPTSSEPGGVGSAPLLAPALTIGMLKTATDKLGACRHR